MGTWPQNRTPQRGVPVAGGWVNSYQGVGADGSSWGPVSDVLSADAEGVFIQGYVYSTSYRTSLAIGSRKSGVISPLVNGLTFGNLNQGAITSFEGFIPVRIPKGSDIVVMGEAGASGTLSVMAIPVAAADGHRGYGRGIPMGLLVNNFGTLVTIGSSPSWTQLSASSPACEAIMICLTPDFSSSGGYPWVEVGIGPSGQERSIMMPMPLPLVSGYYYYGLLKSWLGPFPIAIPAGSRVVGRIWASGGAGSQYRMTVVGFK